ncbi:hypothetical protein EVAR_1029_1 [Eumeta japonica]|uniref:Uncharacterized protein n=1 Tax=Eumeta variegata TaxID=151549 RepID=A0A4C1SH49_EUMVA|nr:hypothetical protein EVAR_1029_1 [Eumeta japonica]
MGAELRARIETKMENETASETECRFGFRTKSMTGEKITNKMGTRIEKGNENAIDSKHSPCSYCVEIAENENKKKRLPIPATVGRCVARGASSRPHKHTPPPRPGVTLL